MLAPLTPLLTLVAVACSATPAMAGTPTAVLDTGDAAAAAGLVCWLLAGRIRFGKPSALGAASGCVAGLVSITPGAGFIAPGWALLAGGLAGLVCFCAVCLKARVGGTLGAPLTGVVATIGTGSLLTGDVRHFAVQVVGVLAAAGYAFVVTHILCKILDGVLGLRADEAAEVVGLDLSDHGEVGYSL